MTYPFPFLSTFYSSRLYKNNKVDFHTDISTKILDTFVVIFLYLYHIFPSEFGSKINEALLQHFICQKRLKGVRESDEHPLFRRICR